MAYNTFAAPVNPSFGVSKDCELQSLQLVYGDGYEQSVADGINVNRRTLTVKWDMLTIAQAATIEAFFVSQNTVPFNYTLPGESTLVWRCLKWRVARDTPNNIAITAEFKGVYL